MTLRGVATEGKYFRRRCDKAIYTVRNGKLCQFIEAESSNSYKNLNTVHVEDVFADDWEFIDPFWEEIFCGNIIEALGMMTGVNTRLRAFDSFDPYDTYYVDNFSDTNLSLITAAGTKGYFNVEDIMNRTWVVEEKKKS